MSDSCDIPSNPLSEGQKFSIPVIVPVLEKYQPGPAGWTVAKLWHPNHRISELGRKLWCLPFFATPSQEFLSRGRDFLG
ncbi:hypothetical protein [Mameliella alba]|uniref:hypothetical protein n=1 Tax=Mameliella alba TaxID=561184 RepID=UPI00105583D7|nr:hypothetical protein [Mameliella alba]